MTQCTRKNCTNDAIENRKMCKFHSDYHRNYERIHAEKNNNRRNARRWQDFIDMVQHYGGCCTRCGNAEPMFLQFHHINGDGGIQRSENASIRGGNRYTWFKANGYPEDLELICANCHLFHHRKNGFS